MLAARCSELRNRDTRPPKPDTTPRRFFLARIEGRGLDTNIEPSGHKEPSRGDWGRLRPVQMQDALRQAQGGSAADTLVKSYDISPAQARMVVRAVGPAFAWALETASLNRGGLADLVEAVGQIDKLKFGSNLFHDDAARASAGPIRRSRMRSPCARAASS